VGGGIPIRRSSVEIISSDYLFFTQQSTFPSYVPSKFGGTAFSLSLKRRGRRSPAFLLLGAGCVYVPVISVKTWRWHG